MKTNNLPAPIQNSIIFHQDDIIIPSKLSTTPYQELTKEEPMRAGLRYRVQYPDAKIIVLNPGSFTYPALSSFEKKYFSSLIKYLKTDYFEQKYYHPHRIRNAFHNGLALNEAIYIPDILIQKNKPYTIDTLTCSPPQQTNQINYIEYQKVLTSRITFIKNILEHLKTDIVILNSFGGQDVKALATLYSLLFQSTSISTIVYSVPEGFRNYNTFLLTLGQNINIYKSKGE